MRKSIVFDVKGTGAINNARNEGYQPCKPLFHKIEQEKKRANACEKAQHPTRFDNIEAWQGETCDQPNV
jgi:hypothetical protein